MRITKKLSIIIPTINRIKEIEDLLDSVPILNRVNFEIIIIDQNSQDIISDLIESFKSKFDIHHYRIDQKGASLARNYGINKAVGEILCFPDDDCKFLPETIQIAIETIEKMNCDVVFGKCIDETGNDSVIKWSTKAAFISQKNCDDKFVEATMFAKREVFDKVIYDENLGVGTFHGSGEAYDLVLNLLNKKFSLYYNPDIIFYHPNKVVDHLLTSSIRRVFSYSCGFGRLCLKHKLYKKLLSRIILVSGFIPLSLLIAKNKTRYYFAEILGILSGIIVK